MPRKRVRTGRTPKTPPYYDVDCMKCGRLLHMRKGKKPKCPICDGNRPDGMVKKDRRKK